MAARARARARARGSTNTWPGFVDALAGLLLAFIFLLVVFVLYQFFLRDLLSDQDAALERLNREIAELGDLLSLERQASADLRLDMAQLAASLQSSTAERDELVLALRVQAERADDAEAALAAAQETTEVDRETIAAQLSELESLRRDITALRTVRDELEAEVGRLGAAVSESETAATALRDRAAELEARLASEEERTALAQAELEKREIRLAEVLALQLRTERDLGAEREVSTRAKTRLELLNQQILALREQLARIEVALEATEAKDREQSVVISDLGRRLNLALAQKVEELQRYRSEFFGRLRRVLAGRQGFTIIGDRFVFQSEVLFASGSSELGFSGKVGLNTFATELKDVMTRIPQDLPWILQVDGHTDRIPINTPRFPSNWDLSAARAIEVVNYLVTQGIPPARLSATGYGEFQPIDERDDEIALRRNRRIELKLTQR